MSGDLLRGEGGDLAVVGPGGEDAGLVHPHHLAHHQAPAAVAHQLLRLDPRPGNGVRHSSHFQWLGLSKGLKCNTDGSAHSCILLNWHNCP